MQNRTSYFIFRTHVGGTLAIEVTPKDTLGTLKEKIAEKLNVNSTTTNSYFADGYRIIYVGMRQNNAIEKKYSDLTLISEMTDIFDIQNASMGLITPLRMEDFKNSPFVYIRGTNTKLPIPSSIRIPVPFQLMPSRYQQLTLEQKHYLSEKTQSTRHSIDIGEGRHPSTEHYFNSITNEEQLELLAGFGYQASRANEVRCSIQ